MTADEAWPLFGLVLRTPRLELHPVRDEDLDALVAVAAAGIHPADQMPFATPWSRATGDELRRAVVQHQWRTRAEIRPGTWNLCFAVLLDGRVIGVQDLRTDQLAVSRSVSSGSWLGQRFQGQGFGSEMRAAILSFAFDFLGAERAESGAASWNAASLAVSAKLGYRSFVPAELSGHHPAMDDEQHVELVKDEFVRPPWKLMVDGWETARIDLLEP